MRTRLLSLLLLALPAAITAQPGSSSPSPPAGRAYLFTLDLAGTPLDEFPGGVKALNGVMTVVDKNGQHMLRASSPSELLITLPQVLPAEFTVEVDLIPKRCCNPEDFMLEGTPARNRGAASVELTWHPAHIMAVGGGGEMYQSDMPADLAATTPGNVTHVVVTFSGTTVKLYTNGRRLYTLEKQFVRGRVLRVWLGGETATNPMYLAGLSVLSGAVAQRAVAANAGGEPGGGGVSSDPQTKPQPSLPPGDTSYVPPVPPGTGGSTTPQYRLVALGFKVLLQTNDDILTGDGAGDEVYLAAVVNTTTRNLDVANLTNLTSATYGDIGPGGVSKSGRIAAGTASPSGGLKTFDQYPAKIDPAMATSGTPTGKTFPLLLWQGALDDPGMIVVHPTLWEEDTGKNVLTTWFSKVSTAARSGYTTAGWTGAPKAVSSQATIFGLRDQEQLGPPLPGLKGAAPTVYCGYGLALLPDGHCAIEDRPIGLTDNGDEPYYRDRMLVLTRPAIEKALSLPPPRPGVSPGVIVMTLLDAGPHAVGIYELYLRIERVP